MFRKLFVLFSLVLILALSVSAVHADESDPVTAPESELETDYPWRGHAAPFDFMFNSMIDTHQQTRLDSNGVLHGFIYIHIIGVAEDGIPIAEKADCAAYPDECVVGWVVKGIPYSATLVHRGPRVWLVDPAGLPKERGYLHFHWLGTPYKPHGLVLDTAYDGYLLKRVAATTFYWLGGNDQGGSGGEGGSGGCGGCSGDDHSGDEGDCAGGGGMGGGDMGGGCSDGGEAGGCSGEDHTDGGCTGDDHTGEEGGCSGGGGEMGGGNPGHGGRLVIEGLDSHSNITTDWEGTWLGGCEED